MVGTLIQSPLHVKFEAPSTKSGCDPRGQGIDTFAVRQLE